MIIRSQHPMPLRSSGIPFSRRPPAEFDSGFYDAVQNLMEKVQDYRKVNKGKVGFYDKKAVFKVARIINKGVSKMVTSLGALEVRPEFNGKQGWTIIGEVTPDVEGAGDKPVQFFTIKATYVKRGVFGYKVTLLGKVYTWTVGPNGEVTPSAKQVKTAKRTFNDETEFAEGLDDWLASFGNQLKQVAKRMGADLEKARMVGTEEDEGDVEEAGSDKSEESPLKQATLAVKSLRLDNKKPAFNINATLNVLDDAGDLHRVALDIGPTTAMDEKDVGATMPIKRESKGKKGTFFIRSELAAWLSDWVNDVGFFNDYVKANLDKEMEDDFELRDLPTVGVDLKDTKITVESISSGKPKAEPEEQAEEK